MSVQNKSFEQSLKWTIYNFHIPFILLVKKLIVPNKNLRYTIPLILPLINNNVYICIVWRYFLLGTINCSIISILNIYLDQVDTDKQTTSSDIPNTLIPSCQLLELCQQVVAHLDSILHQLLLLNDIKNSVANGTAHRVATVSVEIFHSLKDGGFYLICSIYI